MFDMRKFGRYLYDLRMELGLTQLQLASRLNVSRQTVSKYEMGQSFPDIQILIILSRIFGKSIDELVSCGETIYDIGSIIKMAPFVKENVLNESLGLISDLNKKINNEDFTDLDEETLGKIIPFLDESAKENVLYKVIDGEISYGILYELIPYSNNIMRLIEAAVLDGAVDKEALDCIHAQLENRMRTGKEK